MRISRRSSCSISLIDTGFTSQSCLARIELVLETRTASSAVESCFERSIDRASHPSVGAIEQDVRDASIDFLAKQATHDCVRGRPGTDASRQYRTPARRPVLWRYRLVGTS